MACTVDCTQRSENSRRHELSQLLSQVEREILAGWLGKNLCLASGVCQLLVANGKSQWSLLGTGVVCFVKDYQRKIHAIQFFDQSGQVLMEQILYKSFSFYSSPIEKLLQFEGEESVHGLNFCDLQEARAFRSAFEKLEQRRQRISQNLNQINPTSITSGGIVCQPVADTKNEKSKKKKKKLSKADIGLPNVNTFRHLSHFDITPQRSFVSDAARAVAKLDPLIRDLLESIGEAPEKLNNEEQQFVCDFIEKQGGIGNVKKEMMGPASTVRFRANLPSQMQQAKPSPAAGQENQFVHSSVPKARIACAPPPPPPQFGTIRAPPPPPPELSDDKGDPSAKAIGGMKSDLLMQIQQGKKLKSAGAGDTWPRNARANSAGGGGGGIAEALAKALAERRQHFEDEEASGNESDYSSNRDSADWD